MEEDHTKQVSKNSSATLQAPTFGGGGGGGSYAEDIERTPPDTDQFSKTEMQTKGPIFR